MPTEAYNVGRDVSFDIIDPVQGVLRFKIKTGFKAEPINKDLTSNGLDGIDRFAVIPGGHRLSFEFDRADRRIDDYFANQEANYFNGIPTPNVSITETITEVGGGVSQYRFTGVALKLTQGGDWKGDTKVSQTIEGMASRKIRIA